jgi:hypothetical protein
MKQTAAAVEAAKQDQWEDIQEALREAFDELNELINTPLPETP